MSPRSARARRQAARLRSGEELAPLRIVRDAQDRLIVRVRDRPSYLQRHRPARAALGAPGLSGTSVPTR